MNKIKNVSYLLCLLPFLFACENERIYNLADYGLIPDCGENASPLLSKALKEIAASCDPDKQTIIILPKGKYHFYPDQAEEKEYYISNHEQVNPKYVGLVFENMENVIFDGQGAELLFHGRMLPVSLINSKNTSLKNFSVDFPNPHISQVKIIQNDTVQGCIMLEVAPWVEYKIENGNFISKGEGWEHSSYSGIAFEKDSKRLIYRGGDIRTIINDVEEISPGLIRASGWKDSRLIPGTILALRPHGRPTPGIFVHHSFTTVLENITIHYAEGMGLLAQLCENITLEKFSVCLKGADDPRYFTTQADATHFSGCKGNIISKNGLYEGMMDDAINVHGTYLKVIKREDDFNLIAGYMHPESYGFDWGFPGDKVQFINAATMEITGNENRIRSIQSMDRPTVHGAKEFKISFEEQLPESIHASATIGIENLEWTPDVIFAHNTIRNNRARGSLFSTPGTVIVENNYFDHTSGTAILLCGDCNGWFETGACRDVTIRNNTFINSLATLYQFTNAVISIYPEIPELENQQQYFHSNIFIEDNYFETFDKPLVYAKSVNGLVFRNNIIRENDSYPPYHWNKHRFFFEHVTNFRIENNTFDSDFDINQDLRNEI